MPTLSSVVDCRPKSAVFWSRWEIFSWGTDFVEKCWCDSVKRLCGNPGKTLDGIDNPPWCLPAVLELPAPGRHTGAAPCGAPAPRSPPRLWGRAPSLCLGLRKKLFRNSCFGISRSLLAGKKELRLVFVFLKTEVVNKSLSWNQLFLFICHNLGVKRRWVQKEVSEGMLWRVRFLIYSRH